MLELKPGATISGFEILSVRLLEEFQGKGIWARHTRTDCQVYHLQTDEQDNLFAFAFKTPPKDSKGVAHILEHSVLCGSQNFPVKDPFLLLLKGSMHTYLNALTFPDKTVYPGSSQVEKDFYNLMRVYGDAVFFPLLQKEAFLQEGHRREIREDGRIEATGVVFNEMKGNYSSHDSIAAEWAYRSLFEDSPYAHDSGGEPEAILDLSYEEFVQFHRTYYHPSNCYVFFFGNLPTENHLAFLDTNFLSRFEGNKEGGALTVPTIHPMPRWQSPRRVVKAYPAGEGETLERGASVTLNWLLGTITDPFHVVSFEVLTEVLLGHAGSPLQKALIESGLGEDLSPATGLETEALEVAFSVGLRGTSPQKEKAIEELVFTTLDNLVSRGIDREFLEGALRRVEFRNREVKAGASFGMRLMRRALRGWIHGEPPERTLEFQKWMEVLKETVQKDPRYFEKLIERYFIQSSHRTTLVVVPDPELGRKMEEAIRNRLDQEYGSLTPAERKALEEDIRRFREFQERPDPEEALARIPSLSLEEVPPIFDRIPSVHISLPGIREGWAHDLFTNGIVYLDFAIDLEGTEKGPYLFLPLYTAVLTGIGAGGKPYDRIALDLQMKTGGFSTSLEAGTLTGGGQHVRQFLFLRLKTLEEQVEEGLELVRNLLLEPDLEDSSRLEDLLLEYRNDLKSSIIPEGSMYVASRAERGISRAERKEELWKGISQFLFVHSLRGKVAVERLANRLHQIKTALLCQNRMYVNITCPQDRWAAVLPQIEKFVSFFPPSDGAPFKTRSVKERYREEPVPRFEGFAVPSAVGFSATAIPGSLFGAREFAHETVLAHLLSTGALWEQIRMKGGAYGAHCGAYGREEVFSFSSYRDPNIASTFQVFRKSLEEAALRAPDVRTTQNGIIGTVAKDMRPLSPSGKSIVAFKRALYNIEDTLREQHREFLLETKREDVRKAAERLLERFNKGYSAVLAGRSALEEAARKIPQLRESIRDLPL